MFSWSCFGSEKTTNIIKPWPEKAAFRGSTPPPVHLLSAARLFFLAMLAFVGAAGLATGPQFTSEGPDEDALVQHPFSWVARAAAAQSGMVEVVVNRTRSSPPRMLPWSLFGIAGRPAAPLYPGGVRPAAPRPPLSPWYAVSPGFGEFFKWMVVAAMLEIGHGMKNMLAYFLVVRTRPF